MPSPSCSPWQQPSRRAAAEQLGDDAPERVNDLSETARFALLFTEGIVNDVVGGLPVAVTWCPLFNTGITFDRRVDGRAEVFDVSGGLYRSALVMFDRRTQSLWPQPLGQAVLGPLLGAELTVLASSLLPWQEVRSAYPDVDVVVESASELEQTVNPYEGYDVSGNPFLFRGEVDDRLSAFVRAGDAGGSGGRWAAEGQPADAAAAPGRLLVRLGGLPARHGAGDQVGRTRCNQRGGCCVRDGDRHPGGPTWRGP